MKLVGKFKKINPILPLYIILGLLAVAVPFRTYQLLFITEAATGFYKVVDWSVYVIYGLSAAVIIVSLLLVNLAKNVPSSKENFPKKSIFLGITSILFALGILFDSVFSFSALFNGTAGQENIISVLLEAVFGAFAVIFVLLFGISHFDGKTLYSQHQFLALAPLAWTTGRIIIRFMRKIAYINVADLMLEIFLLASMMIFFLAFARISSGIANDKSMRSLFSSGYVSIFFCALANIPKLVIILTGNSYLIPVEYPFSVCDMAFALFACAYIINAMKRATVNDHDEIYVDDEVK